MAPSSPPASSVQSPEPWPLPRPPDQCRSPRLEPPFRRTRDVSTERRPRLRRDVVALQIGPSPGVPNRGVRRVSPTNSQEEPKPSFSPPPSLRLEVPLRRRISAGARPRAVRHAERSAAPRRRSGTRVRSPSSDALR
ncbi:pollen-specific leucine-rich repeat extensin-like protein 4 [Iris pallida]|uniref:Pollen-specific leucine-rich repeat extensin-like protein 4 n=1 Tax=Iris pallida TaxID=29817 RepID=A0AAX6GMW6_IRIPA|nr:pollen-specific leucine-rich repeat extensin-like protein 4 [Iris pallida]